MGQTITKWRKGSYSSKLLWNLNGEWKDRLFICSNGILLGYDDKGQSVITLDLKTSKLVLVKDDIVDKALLRLNMFKITSERQKTHSFAAWNDEDYKSWIETLTYTVDILNKNVKSDQGKSIERIDALRSYQVKRKKHNHNESVRPDLYLEGRGISERRSLGGLELPPKVTVDELLKKRRSLPTSRLAQDIDLSHLEDLYETNLFGSQAPSQSGSSSPMFHSKRFSIRRHKNKDVDSISRSDTRLPSSNTRSDTNPTQRTANGNKILQKSEIRNPRPKSEHSEPAPPQNAFYSENIFRRVGAWNAHRHSSTDIISDNEAKTKVETDRKKSVNTYIKKSKSMKEESSVARKKMNKAKRRTATNKFQAQQACFKFQELQGDLKLPPVIDLNDILIHDVNDVTSGKEETLKDAAQLKQEDSLDRCEKEEMYRNSINDHEKELLTPVEALTLSNSPEVDLGLPSNSTETEDNETQTQSFFCISSDEEERERAIREKYYETREHDRTRMKKRRNSLFLERDCIQNRLNETYTRHSLDAAKVDKIFQERLAIIDSELKEIDETMTLDICEATSGENRKVNKSRKISTAVAINAMHMYAKMRNITSHSQELF